MVVCLYMPQLSYCIVCVSVHATIKLLHSLCVSVYMLQISYCMVCVIVHATTKLLHGL